MDSTICPFLGLWDDKDTRLGFPSPGNCCYCLSKAQSISLEYQASHCLTIKHRSCPIALRGEENQQEVSQPLKPAVSRNQALWGIALISILVTGAFLFGLWQNGQHAYANPSETPIPSLTLPLVLPSASHTMGSIPSHASPVPTTTPSVTMTPVQITPSSFSTNQENAPSPTTSIASEKSERTATQCVHPTGWKTYIIQPGDTLYRIGLIYQISWVELQTGNCMGNSVILTTGQSFYVPNVTPIYIPEDTPVSSPTEKPTATLAPPTSTATQLNPTLTQEPVKPTIAMPTHAPTEGITPTVETD